MEGGAKLGKEEFVVGRGDVVPQGDAPQAADDALKKILDEKEG